MHLLLERFQKQKPNSFSRAPTPIDAENWIDHLEKIFEVLECTKNQQVHLAVYKLEGDARFEKVLDVTNAAKNLEMEHANYIASRRLVVVIRDSSKVKGQIRTGATTMAKGSGKVNSQIRTGAMEMVK
ncbi:hypothetical protein Tco_1233094, partial [Tanacetum coccineum]